MKISVLMALYNEPIEWIEESLNSILNQTFKDFEIIVINDNPQRLENFKIIQTYEKKFKIFKYVNNEKNLGLTKSLNIGLKMCEGEYVARMDADDISLPNRFQEQVNFMDHNIDYVICGGQRIDFNDVFCRRTYNSVSDSEIRTSIIFNSPITHPSVLIRKKILDKHNLSYDEDYPFAQDYEFWTRLLSYGKFKNLRKYLIKYRINDNGQTSRITNNQFFKSELIKKIQIKYQENIKLKLNEKEVELIYILSLNENIKKSEKNIFLNNNLNSLFDKLVDQNLDKFILGRFYFKLIFYKKIAFKDYIFKKLTYFGFLQYLREFLLKNKFIING